MSKLIIDTMKELNSVNRLNFGGCLYACYAMYLKAKELGVEKDFAIVQLGFSNTYIKNNDDFLNRRNKKAEADAHFGISYDNGEHVYDSTGLIIDKGFKKFVIKTDIAKFCINALINGDWNWWFSRKEGVKQMSNILGIKIPYIKSIN